MSLPSLNKVITYLLTYLLHLFCIFPTAGLRSGADKILGSGDSRIFGPSFGVRGEQILKDGGGRGKRLSRLSFSLLSSSFPQVTPNTQAEDRSNLLPHAHIR